MIIFAVDKYCDRLSKQKEKRYFLDGVDWSHYFDTEQTAKDFIIQRALNEIDFTENAHKKAIKRYQKCVKKYGA